jgi:serine/threonine-protein kinase
VAFAGDRLVLAYRRETLREYEIVVHVLGPSEELAAGRAGNERAEALVVTPTKLKVDAPKLACSEKLCFVAWRNEPRGTCVTAFEPDAKAPLWNKVFASQGMAVSLASDAAGDTVMAWFDSGRVRMAPLSREGIGDATALGRVHGQQPAPSLVPGEKPGSWLLAWNCFEGGNPELYVARLRCAAP